MTTKTDTRTVEMELRIDAQPDAVWKALTDPDELRKWFPLEARVRPGRDGEIFMSWGPDIEGPSRILSWEPNRHLRTSWFEPGREAHELMVDYTLEAAGGSTRLRLVHSGFGAGSAWDQEYEGVRWGWAFELRSLRHYLEQHQGKSRRVAWARVPVPGSEDEAAERLWSRGGLLADGGTRPQGSEGTPYVLQLASGERLEGKTLFAGPNATFGATVENLEHSLFRTMVDRCSGRTEAWLWLSSWRLPAGRVTDLRDGWQRMLEQLFG